MLASLEDPNRQPWSTIPCNSIDLVLNEKGKGHLLIQKLTDSSLKHTTQAAWPLPDVLKISDSLLQMCGTMQDRTGIMQIILISDKWKTAVESMEGMQHLKWEGIKWKIRFHADTWVWAIATHCVCLKSDAKSSQKKTARYLWSP